VIARVLVQSGVVEDPRHAWKLHARQPGDLGDACDENQSQDGGRRPGHTSRVYVSEESHRGIVPMNHSNNDGTSSAESEEGRLLIKENAFPSGTYPTQSGSARVPRVGECAGKLFAWPLIRDKNRMRQRAPGRVRAAGNQRWLSLPRSPEITSLPVCRPPRDHVLSLLRANAWIPSPAAATGFALTVRILSLPKQRSFHMISG
jgi:hypothetical protein